MPDDGLSEFLPTNPFMAGEQLTFAGVMTRVSSDTALSATRRRDLLSSIRCLLRLMEIEPTATPAAPVAIRERLKRLHPTQAGISAKRLANMKADVAFTLRHLGLTGSTLRNGKGLRPAWQALWESIEDDQTRWKLSRLFRYCSALNVEPDKVDDPTIEDLLTALVEESFVKDPEETIRATIYAWNRARMEVSEWPRQRLSRRPSRRDGWTFPLETFPASFQKDVALWIHRLRGEDPLAEDAVPKPLRPATIKHRAFQVRMFASALVRRNVPAERITGLDVLVEVENFKEALRYVLDRKGGSPTEAIYGLATAMKAIARHHVKVPQEHLEQLTRICARIKVRNRGLTEKNRRRLRQFDDPVNVSDLLRLPTLLESLAKRTRGRKAAVLMQMATAIELLIMTPVRIGNLAGLRLGENLFWTRPGHRGRLLLSIPPEDVKNGEPIEFELPKESAELIERYLDDYRPALFDNPDDWVFPGRGGRAKRPGALGSQVRRIIYKHTGLEVNPHLMRHIGAKIYLERYPHAYEVVRRVLGHKSMDTTTQFYTGFESKAAARHFDEVILGLRKNAVPRKVRVANKRSRGR